MCGIIRNFKQDGKQMKDFDVFKMPTSPALDAIR